MRCTFLNIRCCEGTKAAVMPDQVPEQKKTERSNILLSLEKKMSEEFRNYYVGKEKTALLEEELVVDGKTYFTGYTKEYVKVAFETEKNMANQFVTGKIKGKLKDDIYLLVDFRTNYIKIKTSNAFYSRYKGSEKYAEYQ